MHQVSFYYRDVSRFTVNRKQNIRSLLDIVHVCDFILLFHSTL